jgi:hypothetical protein
VILKTAELIVSLQVVVQQRGQPAKGTDSEACKFGDVSLTNDSSKRCTSGGNLVE